MKSIVRLSSKIIIHYGMHIPGCVSGRSPL